VLNPHIDHRIYRQEMARLERELEFRRALPPRNRHRLPQLRFSLPRRAHQPLASRGGC
jgi:hypothetical protein